MSEQDDKLISRRQLVGGLGAGIATVAAAASTPAFSQVLPAERGNAKLENPLTKYPQPPFAVQPQPWPGLASKMNPVPDHGETSYKGSGRLKGRKALVTGGDSGMGRAAAIAFAREGADVAINYLPAEEPDAVQVIDLIRAAGRKAVAIPGDLRDEGFCTSLVSTAVNALGGLDLLVSNAGRQHSVASILDLTTDLFDWTMKTNICAFLDHQGGGATPAARSDHHRHHVRAGVRSIGRPLRLCANQGGNDELRQVPGEAACFKGNTGERGCAGTDLDAAPDQRRRAAGEVHHIWKQLPAWTAR